MDSSGSADSPAVDPCEHSNEHAGSTRGKKISWPTERSVIFTRFMFHGVTQKKNYETEI
jgi:hypothetical protein